MRFAHHIHGHTHHRGDRFAAFHHAMRGGRGRHGAGDGGWSFDEEGGRGGGRRPRMFDGSELRLVLLRLIGDEPRHGYDLIRAIEERTGGAYAPSPGVVYPTLTLLGEMDQIAETPTEGARKIFAVTEAGRALLEERADEIATLMARLDALAARSQRADHQPVRRAVHNLTAVLRNRIHGGAVDAETMHRIVAMIDETAQKIERL